MLGLGASPALCTMQTKALALVECSPRSPLIAPAQGHTGIKGTRLSQPAAWRHKAAVTATSLPAIRRKTACTFVWDTIENKKGRQGVLECGSEEGCDSDPSSP